MESLCKGTKTAEELGECFHKVMSNGGVSDKWEWKIAIALSVQEQMMRMKGHAV
ncbi:hypothetical protein [Methyloglobulus sp.]|uniref:hypothetical protein n=1 Tax=Methyloglobulus sp. TaxID=2518622 RepID=UPI0032B7E94C